MKFRTEVHIPDSAKKIQPGDKIFSIGSCFSEEISGLLANGELQTLCNPYGTVFNPHAIARAIRRIHDCAYYKEEELVTFNGKFISLEHHSRFDERYAHKTLERVNGAIDDANGFLQQASWVIVTLGTAFVYEFLPRQTLVANCHKIPAQHFSKRLLTRLEISDAIYEMVQNLLDICPQDLRILFTVSPVRHTRDGISENTLSKARLIDALHEVIPEFPSCEYLPVFEIMMDDLRDYRFYKDDLIHPNTQAINYIFEKFGNAFFAEETMDFIEENLRIRRALAHRPSDPKSPEHQVFLEKIRDRIRIQQQKVQHPVFGDAGI